MPQNIYYDSLEEQDADLTIDFRKILAAVLSRKRTIIKVFCIVFAFFALLGFILPKKYEVVTDLYINKTNNSNISEVNPYVINEIGMGGANLLSTGGDKTINNEIELIQSPLVIDRVIRENNLRYKKLFGIIKTKKTGEYLTTSSFLKKGKNLPIENKKNTNVISISYESKDPELSYNVISSVIKNYIALHKEINSYKSKSDTAIIEKEYNRVKKDLNTSVNKAVGLPATAVSGTGNITALSAFSRSAAKAIGNVQGQYIAGEKSRVEISENAAKVNTLSQKLEWAKLVEDMSDSSNVLVIKEPQLLRDFEYTFPNKFIFIIVGIVFGAIAAICATIYTELSDKKVSYSALDNDIIYNDDKNLLNISKLLVDYKDQNISCILFENPDSQVVDILSKYKNLDLIKAEISSSLVDSIKKNDLVVLLCKIGVTDADLYKSIKETIQIHNKRILKEILI